MSKELPTSDDFIELSEEDVEKYKSMIADDLLTTRHRLKKQDSTWTKEKMAESLGVSVSTYKRWEKNGTSDVSAKFKITRLNALYPDMEEVRKADRDLFGEAVHWFDKIVGGLKKPSDALVNNKA